MEDVELDRLIDKRIEDRLKKGLGQFDLEPQVIKERHIDWESVELEIENSVSNTLGNNIKRLEASSYSTTRADNADSSVLATVYDNTDNDSRITLAVVMVTAFEDSMTSANAIPWGSNLAAGDYVRHTAHDMIRTDGKNMTIVDYVYNTSGGSHTVYWDFEVRYIGRSST